MEVVLLLSEERESQITSPTDAEAAKTNSTSKDICLFLERASDKKFWGEACAPDANTMAKCGALCTETVAAAAVLGGEVHAFWNGAGTLRDGY